MREIFNIKICQQDHQKIKEELEQFLGSNRARLIVTVNPEMLVYAKRNPEFLHLLQTADLAVADGFGLCLVTGGKIKKRATGNDLAEMLLQLAYRGDKKIYLLGGDKEQAVLAAQKIKDRFSGIRICADYGGTIGKDGDIWHLETGVIERIRNFAPDILLVGLGHGKQERFIHDFLPRLPSVKIAVGVGGLFAFLSGDIKRAPKIFQQCGLEWLWRLAKEPRRAGRIFTAVAVFPIVYFWDKLLTSRKS